MKTWIEFWDSDNGIYVNARHKAAHAKLVLRHILNHVTSPDMHVLDYGCGEATYAVELAGRCRSLTLVDAAPSVVRDLRQRLEGIAGIQVMTPETLATSPAASHDLVVVNSVLQYLDPAMTAAALSEIKRVLRQDGRVIIADVVPPGSGKLRDALALLQFGLQAGFFFAALVRLVRLALSNYSRIQSEFGFSRYTEAEFLALLQGHGFIARRIHPNFGHNQNRLCFEARLPA
jgi:ubiquinone/menaquinone biosynthesis C-methylase UbiE